MFVGHGALAFAIVGLGALGWGWPHERAWTLALLAALLATLPDIDMLYAIGGLLSAGSLDPFVLANEFWGASTVIHRSVTHSIVVAIPVAIGTALVAGNRKTQWLGYGVFLAVFFTLAGGMGTVHLLVLGAFLLGAAITGRLITRREIGMVPVGIAAGVALISHPFGDLLTGQPPAVLYPLDASLFASRVAIASDPTIHLLGAFFVELAAIWIGLLVMAQLREVSLRDHLRPRAAAGAAYAGFALILPAPTLDVSYPFVFSVLSVGFLGIVPAAVRVPNRWQSLLPDPLPTPQRGKSGIDADIEIPDRWTAVVTGLATITVAAVAYTISYGISTLGPAWPV